MSNSSNDIGEIGYWLKIKSDIFIGSVSWIVPFILLYWFIENHIIINKYKIKISLWFKLTGLILCIFSLCLLIKLLWQVNLSSGIIGIWLTNILVPVSGNLGALLLSFIVLLFSLGVMIAVKWRELFYDTGTLTLNFISKLTKSSSTDNLKNLNKQQTTPNKPYFSPHFYKKLLQSLLTKIKKLDLKKTSTTKYSQSKLVSDLEIEFQKNPKLTPEKKIVSATPPIIGSNTSYEYQNTIKKQEGLTEKNSSDLSSNVKLLPPLSLLNSETIEVISFSDEELSSMGSLLINNLKHFNIEATIEAIQPGPVVTLFELSPSPGTKVSQFVQLSKDLARALSVTSVRVIEVIPGKPFIGIEIPNSQRETVNFHQLLSSNEYQQNNLPLSIALGKDISGLPIVIDLAKTPHLLVAGTTGSGKSVGVNTMILSLLYKSSPNDVKLILIDPKMLELSVYEGIPHLLTPVVTDMANAATALKWAVAEMERRYKLMSLLGVRNIIGFNDKVQKAKEEGYPIKDPTFKSLANFGMGAGEEAPELEKLPYMVVIIDEFADLMMVVGKQIEELISRLAQKARAAGIHLILATQRPSVNVITGLIKANIPTRLAFQVSTKIDSRTILDQGGAEQLLGLGDMLYLAPGKGLPIRAHCPFVSDDEVHQTVNWIKENQGNPDYIQDLAEQAELVNIGLDSNKKLSGDDELFDEAWQVVLRTEKASISRIQRELRIGYNRSARLIEEMQEQGLLSEPNERGQREILVRNNFED